jgi:hypothetical protein
MVKSLTHLLGQTLVAMHGPFHDHLGIQFVDVLAARAWRTRVAEAQFPEWNGKPFIDL